MEVRLLAFAQLGELLGNREVHLALPDAASVAAVWEAAVAIEPELASHVSSTRIARNGHMVSDTEEAVEDGDEIALLPPVGGG